MRQFFFTFFQRRDFPITDRKIFVDIVPSQIGQSPIGQCNWCVFRRAWLREPAVPATTHRKYYWQWFRDLFVYRQVY
jgi:hypothetical protein